MKKRYNVISFFDTLGSMGVAFERAHFSVKWTVIDNEAGIDLIRRNLSAEVIFMHDKKPQELPGADFVIGQLPDIFGMNKVYSKSHNADLIGQKLHFLFDYIKAKYPRFIIFECGERSRNSINQWEIPGYHYSYQMIDSNEMTGMPIKEKRLYLIGIRDAIFENFYIQRPFIVPDIPFEALCEKFVATSYYIDDNATGQRQGLYIWKAGKYLFSETVDRFSSNVPRIIDHAGLRKITHRELATLKGFPDEYDLGQNLKSNLYQLLLNAPNIAVCQTIATQLQEFCQHNISNEQVFLSKEQEAGPIINSPQNGDVKTYSNRMERIMERRFDVFVSSTYEDLIEERKEVTQAILESDCIPVGMEMFPASNQTQWNFIKKVIEKSDFYLIIIAGKYGSIGISEAGKRISYTEMEFDYAVSLNKPILVFSIKNINDLKRDKVETTEDKIMLLEEFRKKASTERLIRFYTNKEDLRAKILSSLNYMKKQVNHGGWIRAEEASALNSEDTLPGSHKELVDEIEKLKMQNAKLLKNLRAAETGYEDMKQKLETAVCHVNNCEQQVFTMKEAMNTLEAGFADFHKEIN